MNEVKNAYSSTFVGGTPCKRKLDFHDQEEETCDAATQTTIKRRKECLDIPALSLSLKESDIRPGSDLFHKKPEESALFVVGKHQFAAFAAMLFCAWETMMRMKRLKQKLFQLSQMAIKNFIATLVGFSFMKQH